MEPAKDEYPTGQAGKRYQALTLTREPFLNRARKNAALTISDLINPSAPYSSNGADIVEPDQGMGARGVNNLSSKLMLALFPPGMPFYRYKLGAREAFELQKKSEEAQANNPQLDPKDDPKFLIDKALSDREQVVVDEFEASGIRSVSFPIFQHLQVAGNALLHVPNKGPARMYSLSNYVVKRDFVGNVLEIYTLEKVAFGTLPQVTQDEVKTVTKKVFENHTEVDVYTGVCRENNKWEIWQEVASVTIDGSKGTFPLDNCHYLALRWSRVDGEDYGRAYVDYYRPELRLLDKLQYALGVGTYVAAKTIGCMKPGSSMDAMDAQNAKPGDIIEGDAADLTFAQVGKGQDYSVAFQMIGSLKQDLGFAFLLNSTVPRNSERTTATEVTFVAQELEDSLGATYSLFSDEMQKPLVRRLERRLEDSKSVRALPAGSVNPVIITGLEALGRSHESERLKGAIADITLIVGAQVTATILKVDNIASDIFRARGLDPSTYVMTTAERTATQQAALHSQVVQSVAPEVVKQAGQYIQQGQQT